MGKSNQINMNSKVDENKDEDEDVVVVTSIITPTITTSNTTIRQQYHLRSLHIVSRWDANYTKKRYTRVLASVPVGVWLEGSIDLHTNVIGLLLRELGELRSQCGNVQVGHLLIQFLG